jgi:hypothetical protein
MGEIHVEKRKIKSGGVRHLAKKPAPRPERGINEVQQLNGLLFGKMLQNVDGRNEVELSRRLPEKLTRVSTGQVPDPKASAYLHLLGVKVHTSRRFIALALQKIEEFAISRTQVKDSRVLFHGKIRGEELAKNRLNTGQQIRRSGKDAMSRSQLRIPFESFDGELAHLSL